MSYEKYSREWYFLTKDEQFFVLMHPWYVEEIKKNVHNSIKKAELLFGRGDLHNGPGDAFRHCYWSALLARDIGKDNASEFTAAHESRPGNPKKEKEMDLFNNRKGIEIGSKNPNASDNEIAIKCQNALFNGKLMVIKP